MKTSNKNVEYKTVMRELEPTVRQSKKAILAAKKKWNQDQIMELLQDATLQEIDRSQIRNPSDYEIIDLTDDNQAADYAEYYDDDQDGFFSETPGKVRTRRSINDVKRNEIPREGDHYVDLFGDVDDFSIESLYNNHFHPEPRIIHEDLTKLIITSPPTEATTAEMPPPTNSLGLKIINVMGKSLEDAVQSIHKSVKSIWNVFDQEFS